MTELDRGTLEQLRDRREVRVHTVAPDGSAHRTIIWVVVDERDRVFVRSFRGAGARWYREAISGRETALEIDGRTLPMRVERATDPERVQTCSRLLLAKYAGDRATPAMVDDSVLDTTLELRPSRGG